MSRPVLNVLSRHFPAGPLLSSKNRFNKLVRLSFFQVISATQHFSPVVEVRTLQKVLISGILFRFSADF